MLNAKALNTSEYMGFCMFQNTRLVIGPTLVCPLRVIWREYFAFCTRHRLAIMPANRFVLMLERDDGVVIKTKDTKGVFNRFVEGLGFQAQKENIHACDD